MCILQAELYVWCGKGMKDRNDSVQNIKKRKLLFHAFATWKKDYDRITRWCDSKEILKVGSKLSMMMKLRSESRCFFYTYVENVVNNRIRLPWINNKIYPIDQVWDYYMMFYDKYMICPSVSLTRDWGCDGSGANYTEAFDNNEQILEIRLDNSKTFDCLKKDCIEIDRNEVRQHDLHTYNRPKSLIHAWKACIQLFWKKI